jgi:hypothetical protein
LRRELHQRLIAALFRLTVRLRRLTAAGNLRANAGNILHQGPREIHQRKNLIAKTRRRNLEDALLKVSVDGKRRKNNLSRHSFLCVHRFAVNQLRIHDGLRDRAENRLDRHAE